MSFPLMPTHSPFYIVSGSFTGGNGTSFVVPAGVTSVSATLSGAKGGGGGGNTELGGNGGRGALVVQTALAVTPGETLTISGGIGGTAGTNGTTNTTVAGGAGTTLSLLRGATTLMSAGGGGGGGRATSGAGTDAPGIAGTNSSTGTGGTVTTGGGTNVGGSGGRNSTALLPTAGGAGSVTITYNAPVY